MLCLNLFSGDWAGAAITSQDAEFNALSEADEESEPGADLQVRAELSGSKW